MYLEATLWPLACIHLKLSFPRNATLNRGLFPVTALLCRSTNREADLVLSLEELSRFVQDENKSFGVNNKGIVPST